VHSWTLFAGKTYQLPLYEVLSWGLAWTLYAAIYAYRDDRGMTLVERGIDKQTTPTNRTLSIIGHNRQGTG
jgi:hypothetical protein